MPIVLMPSEKAWINIHLMRCKINTALIFQRFIVNAALAHNLNGEFQASRRRCPLAQVHDGFPQQRS
jgi:hypothetical protein